MKLTAPSLVLLATSVISGSAYASGWNDQAICRAAAKTYFFLNALPAEGPIKDDRYGLVSSSGNLYFCKVNSGTVEFYWKNKSGESMTSKSTKYSLSGDNLTVTTDMMNETFHAP